MISLERQLVPWPKKVCLLGGALALSPELSIALAGEGDQVQAIKNTLAKDLVGLGWRVDAAGAAERCLPIQLVLVVDEQSRDEEYRLRVDDGIRIQAASPDGLFRGTRTLLQLLAQQEGTLPTVDIHDYPDYEFRSVLVDVARKPHSATFHRWMIKRIAQFKLNRYLLHFTDNQSYTLPSEAYPALNASPGSYTKQELQELVTLAQEYHVTLVPELEVPGHSQALCSAVPEVRCGGGGSDGAVCVGSSRSMEAIETLIGETAALFPGRYFHMGGDEVALDQVWCHCPECTSYKSRAGLADNVELYHDFLNRINRYLRGLGKRTIVWEGFHVDRRPVIDHDVLVFSWEHVWAQPDELVNAGYDIVNSSWSPLYVADAISMTSPEDMVRWHPLLFGKGRSPVAPKYWKEIEPSPRMLGANMCSWALEEKAEEGLLFGTGQGYPDYGRPAPRIPIMAERAWSGNARSPKALMEALGQAWW